MVGTLQIGDFQRSKEIRRVFIFWASKQGFLYVLFGIVSLESHDWKDATELHSPLLSDLTDVSELVRRSCAGT